MLDLISECMYYSIQRRLVNTFEASNRVIKYCMEFPSIRLDAILDRTTSMPYVQHPTNAFVRFSPTRILDGHQLRPNPTEYCNHSKKAMFLRVVICFTNEISNRKKETPWKY